MDKKLKAGLLAGLAITAGNVFLYIHDDDTYEQGNTFQGKFYNISGPCGAVLPVFSNPLIIKPLQKPKILCQCNPDFIGIYWETDASVIRILWA